MIAPHFPNHTLVQIRTYWRKSQANQRALQRLLKDVSIERSPVKIGSSPRMLREEKPWKVEARGTKLKFFPSRSSPLDILAVVASHELKKLNATSRQE